MKTVSAGKKSVDKLVTECTENIDKVKIAEITSMALHSAGHVCVCLYNQHCNWCLFCLFSLVPKKRYYSIDLRSNNNLRNL